MRDVVAGVLEPRRVVDHEPRAFELRARLRELELDSLKVGERLPELRALLHVLGRGARARRAATPIICAPMPMRPSFSVSIAIL